MRRAEGAGLRLVGVKLEADTWQALADFAEQNGLTLSSAGKKLIEQAIGGEGAARVKKDLRSEGYRDGLRRASHKIQTVIRALFHEEE